MRAPEPSDSTGSRTATATPRLAGVFGFASTERPDRWPRLPGAPHPERLQQPSESLPGVGPAVSKRLAKLGLRTVRDLLEHVPFRYEAAVPERPIAELLIGEEAAVAGTVKRMTSRRTRRRLTVQTAVVADASGTITAVWFN